MSEKTKKEQEAVEAAEKIVLVSPGGHKYELSVSDSGNLQVKLQPKAKKGDDV